MSVEQIEAKLLALPESERRQFLHWVDDHRHEILPGEDEISDDLKREILRRSAELRDHPGLAEPVDSGYFERVKRKVADALARKASAV
jgi:hypothetical protein